MILLNMYIKKRTYSEERAYRLEVEKILYQNKRDKLVGVRNTTSLCCRAATRVLYFPNSQENEVRTIRICTACNTEAPKFDMFRDSIEKIEKFFIELNQHKTNNK